MVWVCFMKKNIINIRMRLRTFSLHCECAVNNSSSSFLRHSHMCINKNNLYNFYLRHSAMHLNEEIKQNEKSVILLCLFVLLQVWQPLQRWNRAVLSFIKTFYVPQKKIPSFGATQIFYFGVDYPFKIIKKIYFLFIAFHWIHESHCTWAGDFGGGGAFLLRGVVPLDGGLRGGGACWCGQSFMVDKLESKAAAAVLVRFVNALL